MQKKPLYIMLVLFIAPIALAKLVLIKGWYQGGETNAGQLISPPLLLDNTANAWLLLYNPPASCEHQCLQSLWQIQQTHTLLASEGERVQTYLTSTINKPADMNQVQLFGERQLDINQIHNPAILTTDIQALAPNTLYLVDPLGNAFMRYQFPADYQTAITVSAGLLKDLKRLLKISKIG